MRLSAFRACRRARTTSTSCRTGACKARRVPRRMMRRGAGGASSTRGGLTSTEMRYEKVSATGARAPGERRETAPLPSPPPDPPRPARGRARGLHPPPAPPTPLLLQAARTASECSTPTPPAATSPQPPPPRPASCPAAVATTPPPPQRTPQRQHQLPPGRLCVSGGVQALAGRLRPSSRPWHWKPRRPCWARHLQSTPQLPGSDRGTDGGREWHAGHGGHPSAVIPMRPPPRRCCTAAQMRHCASS